jgi:hypothetical protein
MTYVNRFGAGVKIDRRLTHFFERVRAGLFEPAKGRV